MVARLLADDEITLLASWAQLWPESDKVHQFNPFRFWWLDFRKSKLEFEFQMLGFTINHHRGGGFSIKSVSSSSPGSFWPGALTCGQFVILCLPNGRRRPAQCLHFSCVIKNDAFDLTIMDTSTHGREAFSISWDLLRAGAGTKKLNPNPNPNAGSRGKHEDDYYFYWHSFFQIVYKVHFKAFRLLCVSSAADVALERVFASLSWLCTLVDVFLLYFLV